MNAQLPITIHDHGQVRRTFADQLTWELHQKRAIYAFMLFRLMCRPDLPAIPGADTPLRLASLIEHGLHPEEAAGREYLHRWNLALTSQVFDAPHTLGM